MQQASTLPQGTPLELEPTTIPALKLEAQQHAQKRQTAGRQGPTDTKSAQDYRPHWTK